MEGGPDGRGNVQIRDRDSGEEQAGQLRVWIWEWETTERDELD